MTMHIQIQKELEAIQCQSCNSEFHCADEEGRNFVDNINFCPFCGMEIRECFSSGNKKIIRG